MPYGVPSKDWDLCGRAEDKATGADIHTVRGLTSMFSGFLACEDMRDSKRIPLMRETLQLYVNGMSINDAYKKTGL